MSAVINDSVILENALDAVVAANAAGEIVYWNKQAELTFGWSKSEALGQSMTELIVPPHMRERHEQGMKTYLRTREPRILNRRIEVPALKKDKSEFPSELTVSALEINGETVFYSFIRDISDRFASRNLIDSERQNLLALFRETPEMICILDGPEHRFTFVNEAHIQILGFDATGKSVREAQPESVEVHVILDNVFRTGETFQVNAAPITVGNRIRYFNLTFAARRDEKAAVVGVTILGIESTDDVLTLTGFRLQRDAFRLAVNGSPLGEVLEVLVAMVEVQAGGGLIASVLTADPDGKRLFHGAAPNLPKAYNDLVDGIEIGMNVGSCGTAAFTQETVVVTDIETDERWANYREAARIAGVRACWSTPVISSQNNVLGTFALYSKVPRVPTPKELEIIDVAARVTGLIIEKLKTEAKLKEALARASENEYRLNTMFETSPSFMAVLQGPDFVYERANSQIYNLLGKREIVGKAIADALPELAGQGFLEILKQVRETGESFIGKEFPAKFQRTENGPLEEAFVDFVYQADQTGEGVRDRIFVHGNDVTEKVLARKELETRAEELRVAKDEAEHANELKSAFLANMSHEIRTPLGAMLGFADLMRDPGLSNNERANYIDVLSRNGEQLSVIINDILDLSKVEAGHLTLEYTDFDPRKLAEEALSLLRVKAKEKDLVLEFYTDGTAPELIVSDPTRVRQVLLNLVANAVKFTKYGSVSIRSYGCKMENGRDAACFEIVDTGIGLAQDKKQTIFEAFVQADGSMTRRFGGTGLGLALSRQLARALGGDITVLQTEENIGTTFLFTIEDRPEKRSYTAEVETVVQAEEVTYGPNTLKGLKVLVVDDAPDNQALLWRFLTKHGAVVDSAENGLLGYRKALTNEYDIVLMDIQMPEMDGYTATHNLRSTGYAKPIVALTAHAMSEVRQKCLNVGCSAHLTKPINTRELVGSILKLTATPA